MSLRQRTLALLVMLPALAAGSASGAVGPPPGLVEHRPAADAAFVPGEIVVRFRPGVAKAQRAEALDAAQAHVERELGLPRLVLADTEEPVAEAVRRLERLPEVLYAEPNYVYRAAATIPNDPRFGELWGLHQPSDADVDAPEAWELTTGSADVTVAVADTGVALGHPDLAPNIWTNLGESGGGRETNGLDDDANGFVDDWRGWDFVDDDNLAVDEHFHGTHVAGTVGARGNDATGVAGLSWRSKLMALRVLDATGSGTNAGMTAAFSYACASGARVVNASLGGTSFSNAMRDAIVSCPNTLFVVAAGNDGLNLDTNPVYPCLYHLPSAGGAQNLLCVAATTSADALAGFSNFSATRVHLAAPGDDILSSIPAQQTLAVDSFEDAGSLPGTWTTSGTSLWSRTNERSVSPTFSVADSPGGNYPANADMRLQRAVVSLAGLEGCDLVYNLRLSTQTSADRLWIERATTASGPWTAITSWSGSTGGAFFDLSTPLTALEGVAAAHVSFRLTSNASTESDGAHLDDVAIRCLADAFGANDYVLLDGTSMATPHVAGAAALLWAYKPAATVAEVRAALLDGVDPLPALAGKTVTGGRLNLARSLELLEPSGSTAPADFDGDGDTDVTVWRPANGVWYVQGGAWTQWGAAGDVPVPADYDGDGETDVAVWRPSEGVWYLQNGPWTQWGSSSDIPVPGDYDGDGDTDIAVWRPSNGVWYQLNGPWTQWGADGDVPVPGDYDGDGDTDIAVWRPSNGNWYVLGGAWTQWGADGDVPVPGDYDGDRQVDIAVWRPADGVWYVQSGSWTQWGADGDVPAPGDYDGDGRVEPSVFRPSSGVWYPHGSASQQWGAPSDEVIPLPPAVRLLRFS